MVMTPSYAHAKDQGQRSLRSEWKQTDGRMDDRTEGRTDGTDCITFLANAVGSYTAQHSLLLLTR